MNEAGRRDASQLLSFGWALQVTMSTTPAKEKEIVVPQHVRRKAGIKAGEPLAFVPSDGGITIRVKRRRSPVDPADLLTPAEAALVRKAEPDMKTGQVRDHRSTAS